MVSICYRKGRDWSTWRSVIRKCNLATIVLHGVSLGQRKKPVGLLCRVQSARIL